jgi:hypothetical protein
MLEGAAIIGLWGLVAIITILVKAKLTGEL